VRRLKCFGYALLGLLSGGLGAAIVLYVYALASIVNPRLNGMARWRAVAVKMFLSTSVVPTMLGMTLVVIGVATTLWGTAAACGLASGRVSAKTVRWIGLAWFALTIMAAAILLGL
jgi:hypothetical protein